MVCKRKAVDLFETKGATRTYTVGCSFDKLVPDEGHKALIREAVQRAHKATILATELLNLHVRRCFEEFGGEGLSDVFSANWIYNVYNEVTVGNGAPKVVAELRETRDRFMPAFEPVQRTGMLQILRYDCRNLAAVAANNIWMHFQRRLLSHVSYHCGELGCPHPLPLRRLLSHRPLGRLQIRSPWTHFLRGYRVGLPAGLLGGTQWSDGRIGCNRSCTWIFTLDQHGSP